MFKLKIWILACRPKTLAAAIAPVLIGTALAWRAKIEIPFGGGGFVETFQEMSLRAILCLFCAVCIQIIANLANDYFDAKKGADTEVRKGPLRVTQAGLVTPVQIKRAIYLFITLALISGAFLIMRGGLPILLIGIFSLIFAVLYTAGPWPLAYLGLGDIFVFVFFGLVAVGGTYYVETLTLNWSILAMGIAPGLFSVAILTANNLRDIDEDRLHNKKTLAVRFGEKFAKFEYCLSITFASLVPFIYQLFNPQYPYLVWCSVLCLFMARPLWQKVLTYQKPEELNLVLEKTGKLLFVYGLSFVILIFV